MKKSFSVLMQDQPDTLVRLTGLLYRRGYLVENISAESSYEGKKVLIKMVIKNCKATNQLLQQIYKLCNVVAVEVLDLDPDSPDMLLLPTEDYCASPIQ